MEILRDAYLHNFIGDMEGLIFLMFWGALMILGYFIVQVAQDREKQGRFAGAWKMLYGWLWRVWLKCLKVSYEKIIKG
jgi:hypothetical protein